MPNISTGNKFFFDLIFVPNFFNGSVTLEKSLLDRLLSPIIFTVFSDLTNRPNIRRASVPEFPASIVVFFLCQIHSTRNQEFYTGY